MDKLTAIFVKNCFNSVFYSHITTSHRRIMQGWTKRCAPHSFYRAALNAGRSSYEKAVCPSVRLSVKRVNCDKIEKDLSRSYAVQKIA